MKEFFQENRKIAKTITEVAGLANYLWQKGWAERNAGNISVNLSEMMVDNEFELEHYPMFQLERSYDALANLYFFVTGTGKRMRDLAISPMKNACISKDEQKGECLSYHLHEKAKPL